MKKPQTLFVYIYLKKDDDGRRVVTIKTNKKQLRKKQQKTLHIKKYSYTYKQTKDVFTTATTKKRENILQKEKNATTLSHHPSILDPLHKYSYVLS